MAMLLTVALCICCKSLLSLILPHITSFVLVRYTLIALALRVNVVGYDYTGYGASIGEGVPPTEKQTYKDIERVYEWCLESKLVKVTNNNCIKS